MLKKIVTILRDIGSLECLEKKETLDVDIAKTSILNLRNLGLKSIDVITIADVLAPEKSKKKIQLLHPLVLVIII